MLPTLLGRSSSRWGRRAGNGPCWTTCSSWPSPPLPDRLGGLDLSGFTAVFADGEVVETGDLVPAADLLAQLGTVPGLSKVLQRLGYDDAASRGQVAAAAEFALEGLHLTRRIDKDTVNGRTVYGAA